MAKTLILRPAKKAPSKGAKTASALLDEMLPLAEPSEAEVHPEAAVLEVGDPAQLLELAADTALRPFLLCRLAPKVALVDPGRAADLAEASPPGAHAQDPQGRGRHEPSPEALPQLLPGRPPARPGRLRAQPPRTDSQGGPVWLGADRSKLPKEPPSGGAPGG